MILKKNGKKDYFLTYLVCVYTYMYNDSLGIPVSSMTACSNTATASTMSASRVFSVKLLCREGIGRGSGW